MRALLDVDVLIALLDRQHEAHSRVHQWLGENRSTGWASCPLTERGCLRIMTDSRYPARVSAVEVLGRLFTAKHVGNYEFWPDDLSMTDALIFDRGSFRHQEATEVYLLALATKRGGRLLTFNKSIPVTIAMMARSENLVVL